MAEGRNRSSLENILYFAARLLPRSDKAAEREIRMRRRDVGIVHIEPTGAVDVESISDESSIPVSLTQGSRSDVSSSDALIININTRWVGLRMHHGRGGDFD